MPVLLESIDSIARKVDRDVLLVSFTGSARYLPDADLLSFDKVWHRTREQVIKWLDDHDVPYRECYFIWPPQLVSAPYQGHLYLDFPMDHSSAIYQRVASQFENEDGTPRIPGVTWWIVPLEMAKRNAHHDAEGYWDNL